MKHLIMLLGAASLALAAPLQAKPEDDLLPRLEQMHRTGHAEATYHLGMMYHVGAGVPQNRERAFALFKQAADAGDPLGAYKLGCYYDGQGHGIVADDPAMALRYKLIAAEAGYALAQLDVAGLLARQDQIEAALPWLKRSADQGWSQAVLAYSSIHNGMAGVTPDKAVTAAYLRIFMRLNGAKPEMTEWLATFESGMTKDEKERATVLQTAYAPTPHPLTKKALSGQDAALTLVAAR